jgi:hypothetical protein
VGLSRAGLLLVVAGVVAGASTASAAPVPDVRGLPYRQAVAELRADGFRALVVWSVRSGVPGRVTGQLPDAAADHDPSVPVGVVVSTGLRPSGRPAAEFRTPGGAAHCQVDTVQPSGPALVCWRRSDGRTLVLDSVGAGPPRSVVLRRARGIAPAGFRTVGAGGTWRRHGIRCVVQRGATLRCVTRSGNGFVLGRLTGVRRF